MDTVLKRKAAICNVQTIAEENHAGIEGLARSVGGNRGMPIRARMLAGKAGTLALDHRRLLRPASYAPVTTTSNLCISS
jgi:hypothetical protein